MGSAPSISLEELIARNGRYATTLFGSDHWQGFGIDSSLQRFSGLNSTEELNYYRDQILYKEGYNTAANVIEKLGPELGGLTSVPNAVGLGALIISIILEAVGKSLNKKTWGTAEMLQRVFAEEKAKEVRDLMELYLSRLHFHLGNQQLQLAETRRIEADLSAQLIRLKNSMLKDGHMNTQFLKQWVNGAAFHTQMLIHQARLEGTDGSRALRAAGLYQQHLNLLLEKYKKYLETAFDVYLTRVSWYVSDCCMTYTESPNPKSRPPCVDPSGPYGGCLTNNQLVEVLFSYPQITWAKTYFSDLRADIPTLVRQNSPFHISS